MFLIHSTDENRILDILKDNYLKSSNITNHIRMNGNQKSPYIFLRLGKRNDTQYQLCFDSKLLLDNDFYLQVGWNGYPTTTKIQGKKLNVIKFSELLKEYNRKITIYSKLNDEHPVMSNEILLSKKVSLVKYLTKIKLSKPYNDKIINFCKINYPNVLIVKE
jgi:hypothetical protein